MSTRWILLIVPLLGLAGGNVALAADDGEILDEAVVVDTTKGETLADRIASVTRRSFVKRNRLEIFPAVGTTFNDPFYDTVSVGGGLAFHVFESLSLVLSGDYYLAFDSPPEISGIGQLPPVELNRPSYSGRLEVAWAPFYGKLSLLAEKVIHFDAFISLGGGVLGPSLTNATGMGTVAVGQHFFLTEWMGLRWELRYQGFMMDRNPRGEVDPSWQSLISGTIGLSFWVPPDFEREAL